MLQMRDPVHPGELLKHDVVEAHGLSVAGAAKALAVSRQALSGLLNGRVSISADMATRFEKAFGVDMGLLLRMQASYDIAQARRRADRIDVRPFRPAA